PRQPEEPRADVLRRPDRRQACRLRLRVRHRSTLGIYAVATPPPFRRRGVSATPPARAIRDGRARGCATVTLQAAVGSYAEGLYARLGFATAFRSRAFVA